MTEPEKKKRTFLLTTVGQFLDAAVYDVPEKLPLAPNVRATYNGQVVAVGDNEIWKEAICFPSRQTFVDPVTMSAVFYGTATNESIIDSGSHAWPKKQFKYNTVREYNRSITRWWHYLLRLHCTEDGLIDEVEELSIENNLVHFSTTPKDYPMRNINFDIPVPEGEQLPREELIRITETYFDGLSKFIEPKKVLAHPDCQRIELGDKCTNNKAGFQSVTARFYDPSFYWIVKNRRYPVVDPALGVCCAFVEFEQVLPDASPGWICSEAFKIVDGTFREILCTHKPMCLHGGWEGVDRVVFDK